MDQVQIIALFRKYITNNCTTQETRELFDALQDIENEALFKKLIDGYWQEASENQGHPLYREQMHEAFANTDIRLRRLLEGPTPKRKILSFPWTRYAAACVVLLVGIFSYYQWNHTSPITAVEEEYKPKSTLTFANHQVVDIDDAFRQPRELYSTRGIALVQDSVEYIKVLATGENIDSLAMQHVVLHVARGRQLKIELMDGTLVTLNSSSTLFFPMAFTPSSRNVELEGEAYFEVESNKSWPFFVQSTHQLVQVYGTKFNVKSYPDEGKSTTTLLHGKVSVRKIEQGKTQEEHMLAPGEKIVIAKNSPQVKQETVLNEDHTVAWTQGLFSYNNAPLKDILRDFSRWYNVQVDWERIPDLRFQGNIPKEYSVKEALMLINKTSNVDIKMSDNYITFN